MRSTRVCARPLQRRRSWQAEPRAAACQTCTQHHGLHIQRQEDTEERWQGPAISLPGAKGHGGRKLALIWTVNPTRCVH